MINKKQHQRCHFDERRNLSVQEDFSSLLVEMTEKK